MADELAKRRLDHAGQVRKPPRHAAWLSVLIFFFQAEDGIRDTSVTGVQTCALPIWPSGTAFPDDGRLTLVGDADGRNFPGGHPRALQYSRGHRALRLPDLLGIMLEDRKSVV